MRRDVTIIVALAAVVLVPSILTRDPWNPDEPRYAEVAREMVVTGHYAVPHLNGEVYPDKPAFFFWLVAGLMRLGFGFDTYGLTLYANSGDIDDIFQGFDALSQDQRVVLLTSVGKYGDSLARRARMAGNIASIVEQHAVVFTDCARKKSMGGTAIIGAKELSGITDSQEVYRLIVERRKR